MIFRRVPLQRLEHKQQRESSRKAPATPRPRSFGGEERQCVPEFHMRGLFTVIPSNDVSPLALRLSDVPSDWRDSDAA
jgi:hypothetical protein